MYFAIIALLIIVEYDLPPVSDEFASAFPLLSLIVALPLLAKTAGPTLTGLMKSGFLSFY